MSVRVDKNVLGLYISMYYMVGMNVLYGKKLHPRIRRSHVIDLTGELTSSAM